MPNNYSFQELVKIAQDLRKEYPKGTKVRLVRMDDPQAPPINTIGIVRGVDDTASILVQWDNGSNLNVIYGEDVVEKLGG